MFVCSRAVCVFVCFVLFRRFFRVVISLCLVCCIVGWRRLCVYASAGGVLGVVVVVSFVCLMCCLLCAFLLCRC